MAAAEELKDFINHLIKAKKNIRLYPENNPVYMKTLEEIYSYLENLLETDEDLVFHIKQFEILHDGEVIYRNEDKDESLALFFFKDGIRELRFKKGIPLEEVEDFLKIISTDFERQMVDDDIVTLMWERDFQYIQYVVDDTILIEDETYEEEAVKQVKKAVSGADVMKAYQEAFGIEKPSEVSIVPLTNEDIKSIVQQIEEEDEDKSLKLIHLLFEMLFYASGKGEYEELVRYIKETFNYAISRGNIETVIYGLEKLKQSLQEKIYPAEINSLLKGVEYYINSSQFIRLFGETLDAGVEFEEKELYRLASLMGKESITHFITILGELQNISSRKTVIKLLTEIGKKDLSLLAKGLHDRRWYVVRNVIYIMRQIGNRRIIDYITPLIKHPDKRVKKEVLSALGELGSAGTVQLLKDCLYDEDESVRITAVRSIGMLDSPLSKKVILETIQDKRFKDRGVAEKKEFFKALSKWKDTDTVDYLISLLKKRSFFRKARVEEMKAMAAYALGLIGAKEAKELLEKYRNSKNPLLRENIEFALTRIRNNVG